MSQPLLVVLADDTDAEDHSVLFPLLRERGIAVRRVHPHELVIRLEGARARLTVGGEQLRPDLVLGWVLGDLLLPSMAQLDLLQRLGVRVINDALTLFRTQHTFLDSSQLLAAGVLRYPVITGWDRAALRDWAAEIDGPLVSKPLSGFGGRGLRKVTDVDQLPDGEYYVVPYIENPGRDIRVYTVNHAPVFAMYRYAPEGKWITNVRAGGTIAPCPLTPEIADLAARASRAAGTLIGGIDIGENTATGELVVYEVNSCPTCEPPVLHAVADFLAATMRGDEWTPERDYATLKPTFHASKQHLIR
ncbi:MAG: hypothetical protein Q4G50_03495 [Corynebacterium sp.]|uniref:ATP-grasp domain-containing protein n=1 Tax=Corynebacterium sp. TaxID=1720 RepID=UPI0026DF8E82|nr:hypothetical protein [Corynebacterium sp.]MDO5669047.1 hypothetical protein [Corynebacterium sp.]